MLNRTEQKLLDALEPQAQENGIEIVTVEVIGSKKSPTVRVYIDSAQVAENAAETEREDGAQDSSVLDSKKSGISFDELASSQAWISKKFDEIDPFAGSYTLEVSSPGIDRPLRTPAHFNAQAGEEATVKLKGRINNKSTLRGEILSANDAQVVLSIDGERVDVPFSEIKRANLVGRVEFR